MWIWTLYKESGRTGVGRGGAVVSRRGRVASSLVLFLSPALLLGQETTPGKPTSPPADAFAALERQTGVGATGPKLDAAGWAKLISAALDACTTNATDLPNRGEFIRRLDVVRKGLDLAKGLPKASEEATNLLQQATVDLENLHAALKARPQDQSPALAIAAYHYRARRYAKANSFFAKFLGGRGADSDTEAVRMTYAISLCGANDAASAAPILVTLTQQARDRMVRYMAHLILARHSVSVQDYEQARFHYGALAMFPEWQMHGEEEGERMLTNLDAWLARARR